MDSIQVIKEPNNNKVQRNDSLIMKTPSVSRDQVTKKKPNNAVSQKPAQKGELCDSLTVKAGPKFINSKGGLKNRMKIVKPMKSLINAGNHIAN